MPQYLLSIYQPDGPPPPPEVLGPVMARIAALNDAIKTSGSWVFTGGLHPAGTATVVRLDRDKWLLTDGPFVEAKEHIGGVYVIDVPDLDAALAWARKLAAALALDVDGAKTSLPIEVRPFHHGGGA